MPYIQATSPRAVTSLAGTLNNIGVKTTIINNDQIMVDEQYIVKIDREAFTYNLYRRINGEHSHVATFKNGERGELVGYILTGIDY